MSQLEERVYWLDDDWSPVGEDKATQAIVIKSDELGNEVERTYVDLLGD